MKKSAFFALCWLAASAAVVAGQIIRARPDEDTSEMEMVNFKRSVEFFTGNLYNAFREGTPNHKSIVLSPLSIHLALGLLSMGVDQDTAVDTWQNLRLMAGSNDSVRIANIYQNYLETHLRGPYLKIANAVFTDDAVTIAAGFKDLASHQFGSLAQTLNFTNSAKAAKTMNDWIASKTNNLFTDLIASNSITEYTKVMLINAVHFKADWDAKFRRQDTVSEFFTSPTETGRHKERVVEMMRMKTKLPCSEEPSIDAKVLKLEYVGRNTTMVFILPNEVDGLSTLGHRLRSAGAANLRRMLFDKPSRRRDYPQVDLYLPKFEVRFSTPLKKTLKKVGISKMFSDSADFSNLLEHGDANSLRGLDLIHEAVIKVDEDGTEAAAVTLFGFGASGPFEGLVFKADHPFMYLLIGGDNTILFVGDYVGPK